MPDKLKVLLVASDFHTGIGAMARHIAESADDIDYYFFCDGDLRKRKNEFLSLANSVHIIHWLSNLSWVKFPPDLEINALPAANIAVVHHLEENLHGYGEKQEAEKLTYASRCNLIQVIAKEWEVAARSKTSTPVCLAHHVINIRKYIKNRRKDRPHTPIRIGAFGFARSLHNRKRLDVLVGALTILSKAGYKFELVVQGPYWKNFQDDLSSSGMRITNLGYLPSFTAQRSYRYIDLYVCSSDVEGGPLPVLEALASGVPVISTPVGEAVEALTLGGGILVPKGNSEKLADAIAKIIDHPDLYHQLAQEAVKVSEIFTWENVGKEYKALYAAVLGIKKCSPDKKPTQLGPKFQRSKQLIRDALVRERFFLKDPAAYLQILKTILMFRL